ARTAPIRFIHLKENIVNGHLESAKNMADIACTLPRSNPPPDNELEPRIQTIPESTPPLLQDKVSADIPNDSMTPEQQSSVRARSAYPAAHRGRDRLNDLKERNRKSLLEAKSTGAFWKQVKRLSDPAPVPVSVSAQALKEVFEARLNPPKTLPESFDSAEHRMNKLLASLIPDSTLDSSPEGFFSSEWTEDDAAWLKDHIRKHSLDSATGEDAILYAEIMDIPNDVLVLLCNECVKKQDGPSV
ncbi:hypothetical protein B0H16DRAFT_1336489, partial [Mycena metata]